MQKNIIKRLKRTVVSVITAASMMLQPVLTFPASAATVTLSHDTFTTYKGTITKGDSITVEGAASGSGTVEVWYEKYSDGTQTHENVSKAATITIAASAFPAGTQFFVIAQTTSSTPRTFTYIQCYELHTIQFDANGGTGSMPDWTIYYNGGTVKDIPYNTFTREGYTFGGWSPAVPATMPVGGVECVAQWAAVTPPPPTPTEYTLTFDANGGTLSFTTITQAEGTAVTPPTATREGYIFTGWTPEVPAIMPGYDMTFTAR